VNASTAKTSPLVKLAAFLSVGSLIWTTWSLFDLLGAGPAGVTVAVCADVVWGSVIYAEYRGVRLAGRRWPVALFGWAALLAVAAFLVWHGIADDNLAMAFAGPFLPMGSKVVWALALADMRDPAALTDGERSTLAEMERGMVFEETEHDIRMRQQRMRAELLVSEVSTDFDIEVMRQDRVRDLQRRAPLALPQAASAPFVRVAEQSIEAPGEHDRDHGPSTASTIASDPNVIREQLANSAVTSPNVDRERPSLADLVREQVANTTDNATAVRNVLAVRPDANKESVAASVRRERKKAGPYL
jgi:hypothetical protein